MAVGSLIADPSNTKGNRSIEGVQESLDYWVTPQLAAGTKPMGVPPWSRGPLLHRGGESVALHFG